MSFNENTINYMRISNHLETLTNNQNLIFNMLSSIKNTVINIQRYRERPNITRYTTPSPIAPNIIRSTRYPNNYTTATNTNNTGTTTNTTTNTDNPSTNRSSIPIFSRTSSTQPNNRPDSILRNIEISMSDPITSNILGILNNSLQPSNNVDIEQLLQTTELVIYNNSLDINNTCSICRLDYQENDIIRKINHCSHYFHHNCIDNWFKNHTTCPVCRHSLTENNDNNV